MNKTQKVVVVMPAYNAARTLERTLAEIPRTVVDEIVLVDDASQDNTAELARSLGVEHVTRHDENRGYGGTRKPATQRLWSLGPTRSSCSIPTTSTARG